MDTDMTQKRKAKATETTGKAGSALPEETSDSGAVRFPIVGIGASAGGLAAFEAFFSGMPADTDPGMAFVLVQHLAPDHKSILGELTRSSSYNNRQLPPEQTQSPCPT